MKPLILMYCYYDESHNVLNAMEVFPYVELIISVNVLLVPIFWFFSILVPTF